MAILPRDQPKPRSMNECGPLIGSDQMRYRPKRWAIFTSWKRMMRAMAKMQNKAQENACTTFIL